MKRIRLECCEEIYYNLKRTSFRFVSELNCCLIEWVLILAQANSQQRARARACVFGLEQNRRVQWLTREKSRSSPSPRIAPHQRRQSQRNADGRTKRMNRVPVSPPAGCSVPGNRQRIPENPNAPSAWTWACQNRMNRNQRSSTTASWSTPAFRWDPRGTVVGSSPDSRRWTEPVVNGPKYTLDYTLFVFSTLYYPQKYPRLT